MRDLHCIQCGILIRGNYKGHKNEATKRMGGWIHDNCIPNYQKHKQQVTKIRNRRRKQTIYYKQYDHQYYIKNITKIKARVKGYYYDHPEKRRYYQKETDDIFKVKIL